MKWKCGDITTIKVHAGILMRYDNYYQISKNREMHLHLQTLGSQIRIEHPEETLYTDFFQE
jgi:hypothetical protein